MVQNTVFLTVFLIQLCAVQIRETDKVDTEQEGEISLTDGQHPWG